MIIISKHKNPMFPASILTADIGRDLVNYIDRPDLVNEVLNQIDVNYGSYSSILPTVVPFVDTLKDFQIKELAEIYTGNQLLYRIASLLLNVNPDMAATVDKVGKGAKFRELFSKIKPYLSTSISQSQKQFIGDIVPNNTGISDRFGKGHDGSHIRSPKMGGSVVTIEALKGIVIRQYVQSLPSPTEGFNTLYGVWVLLRDGKVVIYKDLLTVDAKLRKLQSGKLYVAGKTPISRINVSTGDLIGTIRPWHKDDPINDKDVGLHITFIYLKYIQDYKDYLGLTDNQREKRNLYYFPLEKLIAPCSEESPVRCL